MGTINVPVIKGLGGDCSSCSFREKDGSGNKSDNVQAKNKLSDRQQLY